MKIKFLLIVIVASLFLIVPDSSYAQKRKVRKKPNQTKKSNVPSTSDDKIISPDEIRNIVNNSPNIIAAESNLETALSNRQITIKSFNISVIARNNVGDPVIGDRDSSPLLVVVFAQDQKQAFSSLSEGLVDVKCKYERLERAPNGMYRVVFYF